MSPCGGGGGGGGKDGRSGRGVGGGGRGALLAKFRGPRTFAVVIGAPKTKAPLSLCRGVVGGGGKGEGALAFPVELATRAPKTGNVRCQK